MNNRPNNGAACVECVVAEVEAAAEVDAPKAGKEVAPAVAATVAATEVETAVVVVGVVVGTADVDDDNGGAKPGAEEAEEAADGSACDENSAGGVVIAVEAAELAVGAEEGLNEKANGFAAAVPEKGAAVEAVVAAAEAALPEVKEG